MTKLFVGGFPLNITEMELVQLIGPFGTVNTIKIVRDKKTGKCKGYAFLEMSDKIDAENAIYGLNGTFLGDRQLTLNIVEDAPQPKFSAPRRPANPSTGFRRPAPRPTETAKPKRPRKQF